MFSVDQLRGWILGGRSWMTDSDTQQLSDMIMSPSRHVLAALLLLINMMALICYVEAQDSLGFITLDCGLPAGSSYVDEETGIKYISDEAIVETGVAATISPAYNTSATKPWLQTLRSFPEGERNCYKFPVENDREFLVRATFMHGNYDGKNTSLSFSLFVDNGHWDDVQVDDDPTSVISKEIILVTTINILFFCLMNSGNGTPFISLLELRPLKDAPFNPSYTPVVNLMRVDFGSTSGGIIRYPDDGLDRFWKPLNDATWTTISTSEAIDSRDCFAFQPPSSVMRTASLPNTGDELHIVLDVKVPYYVHIYLFFAELEKLGTNQSRQFRIKSSQSFKRDHVSPKYLKTGIVHFVELILWVPYNISLTKTINSTLPPAINALEVYQEIPGGYTHSDQGTVDAMTRIKLAYGIKKNWQADPCHPSAWDGITCYENISDSPRIIALNLSFSGLVGAITAHISDLTDLETLDLSNNGLTGHVPEFFAQMPSLKILNLTVNKLNGTIPPSLIKKAEKNLLLMNLTGNPDLCFTSCNTNSNSSTVTAKTKKSRIVFLVLVSLAAALISSVTAIIVFRSGVISRTFISKKQGNEAYVKATLSLESMEGKKRQFTYSQLLAITNNFNSVLGQGGSGTVYLGHLHGNEVAVKILSPSSVHGYKQFRAEVDVLLRVHHGNLLSLVGYCDDNNYLGLIYEYMANGNLQEYISSNKSKTLSWDQRLKIAVGAAHGLEYLHSGCEPQIVHRDVKTANILLNQKLVAKLADFGLSRSFPTAGASHLFTDVAGTFGYFDPEYFRSRRFTTKSDVYSFGVVLLEIFTSKPAVDETESTTHLSQWVEATLLAEGEVTQIMDPKLGVEYDFNSANKAVQLAMTCVSESSSQRPTMHQVVDQLTDCLELELARKIDKPEVVESQSFC